MPAVVLLFSDVSQYEEYIEVLLLATFAANKVEDLNSRYCYFTSIFQLLLLQQMLKILCEKIEQ